MNYRHAFHAGGFADVLKHAVMALAIGHLRQKPTPFRVIDTHAGAALYDLAGPEAGRTGEWRAGIGRLYGQPLDPPLADLLGPYLEVIARLNPQPPLAAYPGSPALALALLRPQDRLVACEVEPAAARALSAVLRNERRAKAVAIDGWTALTAYVPPPERRGLVLIDPPFEQPGEFARLAAGLAAAHRKWPTGIYLLWYPIKSMPEVAGFVRTLGGSGIPKILRAEVTIAPPGDAERLSGSGLMIVNPPWRLEGELAALLPALAARLAPDAKGGARLDWVTREN